MLPLPYYLEHWVQLSFVGSAARMCTFEKTQTGTEVRRVLSQPSQMPSCKLLLFVFLGLSLPHNLNFSSSNVNNATKGSWKRRSIVTWTQGVLSR